MTADVVLLVEAASKPELKLNATKWEIIADDCSITRIMKIFDGFREIPPHELTLLRASNFKGKAVNEARRRQGKRSKESSPDWRCYILTSCSICRETVSESQSSSLFYVRRTVVHIQLHPLQ